MIMANAERKFYDKAVVKGTAYWPHLFTVDQYSKKYQIDIGKLDTDSVDLLESKGVILKNKDGHPSDGPFIVAKTTRPVKVMDRERNLIDVSRINVGNGSEVKIKVAFNDDHPFVDKYGTSLYLEAVQVLNLVEYNSDPVDNDFD
jgi:hypothetical protein|tara:strand:- start:1992 stop:2426 length:435 start_codon:yes stop_codon:yes gene_type:complete